MPRAKNRNETVKVQPTVSRQTFNFLEELVDIGNYGNTPTTVAAYLIQRAIDDMLRAKLLDRPARRTKRRRT